MSTAPETQRRKDAGRPGPGSAGSALRPAAPQEMQEARQGPRTALCSSLQWMCSSYAGTLGPDPWMGPRPSRPRLPQPPSV